MARIATITALALLAGPALAAGETPFEKAKGWEIERSAPGANGSSCLMSKAYKDPADNDAVNALIFALADDQAVMTFVYEHWTWDKNEKVRVPLMLDKRVAIAKHTWTGDGTSLTTMVPATLVPNMLAAKKMILKLDGANADFDLSGFPEAYESLRRCDVTPVKAPVAAVPSVAEPDRRAAPTAGAPPASAAAPSESTHITQAMTFPGDGDVPPQTAFARNTPKILLGLAVRDVKPGDNLTTTWVAENTDGAAPNYTIASIAIPLGSSPTVSSSLSKPDAGWPRGQYRVDVSHNGGPVEFSQRFTVKD
jgi:hypothetical protein